MLLVLGGVSCSDSRRVQFFCERLHQRTQTEHEGESQFLSSILYVHSMNIHIFKYLKLFIPFEYTGRKKYFNYRSKCVRLYIYKFENTLYHFYGELFLPCDENVISLSTSLVPLNVWSRPFVIVLLCFL
jgi:hypothetical protein